MICVSSFPFHRNEGGWNSIQLHFIPVGSRDVVIVHRQMKGQKPDVEGQVMYSRELQLTLLRQLNQGPHLFRHRLLHFIRKKQFFILFL